jgi:HlyD family secretion protein
MERSVAAAATGDFAGASIRRHILVGLAVSVLLVALLGGWAATANLAGAVIAPATIVVDTNLKKVQHPTAASSARSGPDGSVVRAGDVLVRSTETVTRANLRCPGEEPGRVRGPPTEAEFKRDGLDRVAFPEAFAARIATEPGMAGIAQGGAQLVRGKAAGAQRPEGAIEGAH